MNKKIIALAILIFFALSMIAAPALAEDAPMRVTVDSKAITFPDLQPYVDENYRTLVPIRFPMEAMGVTVEWNQAAQQAILTRGTTTAIFTIGSTDYTLNSVKKTMTTKPIVMQGRTLFPLRYAVEAFDGVADYDSWTNTVLIYSVKHRDDAPELVFYYSPQDAANMDSTELMQVRSKESGPWVKLICTNNDALNYWPLWNASQEVVGTFRMDYNFYPYQSISKDAYYGENSNYRVKPGEELHFEIWVKWKDAQGSFQESLEYEDYVFTVPAF